MKGGRERREETHLTGNSYGQEEINLTMEGLGKHLDWND